MIGRVIKYISAIGLVISLALIIYGMYGPHFETEPLKSSFTFATAEPQVFEFKIGKSEKYMVEIHLENVLPEEQMEAILGDSVKRGEGAKVNIEWSLNEGDEIVASGSNKEYGYSHIWSRGYYGLAIGEISVKKGKSYSLTMYVKSVNQDWDVTEPYVEVGLHPAKLEYLIGYIIYGLLLLVIFGSIVGYFFYKELKKKFTNQSLNADSGNSPAAG